MSGDGKTILVTNSFVLNGTWFLFYASKDSGSTWKYKQGLPLWSDDIPVSMIIPRNMDNTILVSCAMQLADNGGFVFIPPVGYFDRGFYPVAASANGQIIIISDATTGYIYKTTSWTTPITPVWTQIGSQPAFVSGQGGKFVMSDDGSIVMFIIRGSAGYIYRSIDGGASWYQQLNPGSQTWLDIAISSDGSYVVAITASEVWLGDFTQVAAYDCTQHQFPVRAIKTAS
jgi:hypothetical protein